MSQHSVTLRWVHQPHPDDSQTYDRGYVVDYGHGIVVPASAAPAYKGDPARADPEQMLVAALSSCHMLYFLAIAEASGYRVARYDDAAVGLLDKGEDGAMQITRIILSPVIAFEGEKVPDAAAIERLHHRAHKGCFIANSLKTKVIVNSDT